jgi:DNA-binding NarL/FixJ family response regulator
VNGRPTLMIVDNEATRAGIRMALVEQASVCAEAWDAKTAIRAAMRTQPDVCLIGSQIPGGGVAAVRGICRAAPRCAVVVLAPHHDVDELIDSVRAGAVGYVPGTRVADCLARIIRAVAANEAVVPRSMVLELLLEMRNVGSRGGVSRRESQVLGMLRRGHSTAEIAKRIEIAPVTVRRHISELVRKLGVADRSELVAAAGYPGAEGVRGNGTSSSDAAGGTSLQLSPRRAA